ncbi:MAG: hypothetical protein SGCHY_005568, partial [Lobulomycetales sp.]
MPGKKRSSKSAGRKKKQQVQQVQQVPEQPSAPDLVPVSIQMADPKMEFSFSIPRETLENSHTSVHDLQMTIADLCCHSYVSNFNLALPDDAGPLKPERLLKDLPAGWNALVQLVPAPYTSRLVAEHVDRFLALISMPGDSPEKSLGLAYSQSSLQSLFLDSSPSTTPDASAIHSPNLSLASLLPSSPEPPRCISAIYPSKWTPPMLTHKLDGHLAYFCVDTLEGETLLVLAGVRGFALIGSGDGSSPLDVSLSFKKNPKFFSTLPSLLISRSPAFERAFAKLSELRKPSRADALAYVPTAYGMFPWLVAPDPLHPLPRTSAQCLGAPSEIAARAPHNWNEDLQSTRDLSCETAKDRVHRDNSLCRVQSAYLTASVSSVVAAGMFTIPHSPTSAVEGDIPALNPGEPEDMHMYLAASHIFLSQGFDPSRAVISDLGGAAACHVAYSKDIDGIERVAPHARTLGTVLVDYAGTRMLAQTLVPGILGDGSASGEPRVSYGSADGGVVADPGSKEEREEWTEEAKKIGAVFRLVPHLSEGQSVYAPPEAKGIRGQDGRKYWLDMFRSTPIDQNWFLPQEDAEYGEYPHKLVLLRHELLSGFLEKKLHRWVKENRAGIENGAVDVKDYADPLMSASLFDPQSENLATEESLVVSASSYLVNVVITKFISDMSTSARIYIADTCTLTRAFHSHGINMRYALCNTFIVRYLGLVARQMLDSETECAVPLVKDLLLEEMIARVCKHRLRKALASSQKQGSMMQSRVVIALILDSLYRLKDTCGLIRDISERFRFKMTTEQCNRVVATRSVALLRSICLKVGIQIRAREYHLTASGGDEAIFRPSDILALVPVTKSP